jgi:molybdenum cofactor cytidylyltransferase
MERVRSGAVVVAAGLSSRMKAFKPMLPLGDSTIICTLLAGLRSGGVSAVAVVTGHNAERLRAHLADLDVVCLFNGNYATTDMFGSARIGLAYMQERCDRIFFLPGDVPLFAPGSLRLMAEAMEASGSSIVIPACAGKKGHPVLIASRAVPDLLAYGGTQGLKGAMTAREGAVQVLELGDPGLTLDADRPEDYRRLLQYAAERGTARSASGR